jgi:sugar-phosphatase
MSETIAPIEAVIFDLDGLLIDSEPFWQDAEIEVFGAIGVPLTRAMCRQTMGLILHEVIDYWMQRHPWDEARHPRAEVAARVMAGVKARMQSQGQALPGVHRVIERLRTWGVPLAVASSSYSEIIAAALEALRLSEVFSIVRSAEHEPFGKPHPGVFLSTAVDLGVAPTSCLVFEDSVNGLIAAKAARMKCVAVPDAEHRDDPRFALADRTLSSLTEFDTEFWERLGGDTKP